MKLIRSLQFYTSLGGPGSSRSRDLLKGNQTEAEGRNDKKERNTYAIYFISRGLLTGYCTLLVLRGRLHKLGILEGL